eukprot:7206999-Pyramimonas_sp.AAC.1
MSRHLRVRHMCKHVRTGVYTHIYIYTNKYAGPLPGRPPPRSHLDYAPGTAFPGLPKTAQDIQRQPKTTPRSRQNVKERPKTIPSNPG